MNYVSYRHRSVAMALLLTGFCLQAALPGETEKEELVIYADRSIPQAGVALEELIPALGGRYEVTVQEARDFHRVGKNSRVIALSLTGSELDKRIREAGYPGAQEETIEAEGFSLHLSGGESGRFVRVEAADAAGLLYGGFELAEQIRLYGAGGIRETLQNPHMSMRGVKFNLPLDVRTPTYSDPGRAAQENIPVMWDLDFWKAYIDTMARHRYNFISLWNLHPFPSMVRVPEYPEIALDDVWRSTGYKDSIYFLGARGFDSPHIMEDPETLLRMDMDEKIRHWRQVMAYGKERNIRFYIITWNIYTYGTFGKYGITDDIHNPVTRDYYRKSVREMFLTYPDLEGIGLTTGENIPGATFSEKEEWAFDTYGMGAMDAVREQPGRKITFIHRQHEAEVSEITSRFRPLVDHDRVNFIFSFKYAKAHSYSSTNQPYKNEFVRVLEGSEDLKTIWTLRNDDNYYFRWGAPDFVREFIRNIPEGVSEGYYFGSDGYVWGTDFLSRHPVDPNQIDVEKHWFSWMLWGRLGYNPELDNRVFAGLLELAYPGTDGSTMLAALQHASMTYPLTTGFHWGALDFQWYIEACKSRDLEARTFSGFHDIHRFIHHGVHPGTPNIPIPEYVDRAVDGTAVEGRTPYQVSDLLHMHGDSALELLERMECRGDFRLWQAMEDIRAMAFLGKYYAHKIAAATDLQFYYTTNRAVHRQSCIGNLEQTALYWRSYVATASSLHKNPVWFNRIGVADWRRSYFDVMHELLSVGAGKGIPSMAPAEGARILEAEAAASDIPDRESRVSGFTGKGYLEVSDYRDGDRHVEWEYEASENGIYLLDLRYINQLSPQIVQSRLYIDDAFEGHLTLWGTGLRDAWCVDRKYIRLSKGTHTIRLHPDGRFLLDHLAIRPLTDL